MAPKVLFFTAHILMWAMILAPVTAFIAWKKGFNPVIWFFAGGLIGCIALLFLPGAHRFTQPLDEKQFLRERAKHVAMTITGIYLGVLILVLLTGILFSFEYWSNMGARLNKVKTLHGGRYNILR